MIYSTDRDYLVKYFNEKEDSYMDFLQTHNCEELFPNTLTGFCCREQPFYFENYLHLIFNKSRKNGEWFNIDTDIKRYLEYLLGLSGLATWDELMEKGVIN